MPTWMLADLPVIPWCGDREELTEQAIEQVAEAWQFVWDDERNLVMPHDDD
ncbi:hypothetical protein SAMN04487957_110127 [Halomonas shengliensis]|uniref:Uncharacterized protein n=1 Tax=Halomonas shengliensis TaxID=419597 RepID=A0A1H0LW83_9GAMM|nr:hypothetical protein [Halomonas shengliensis]SDO72321.1 hypothetical protein SAMN04487957_110127 [Halomonas shengliensis]